MKRRKIVMALILTMVLTVLSACGDSADSDKTATTDSNIQSESETTSEEDTTTGESVTTTSEDEETIQETTTKEEQTTTPEETIKDTEAETTKKPEPETTTKAEAQTTTKAEAQTTTKAEAQTTTKAEAQTTTKAEAQTTTKAEAQTTTKAEAQTTTKAEAQTTTKKPEPETTTKVEEETTTEPETTTSKEEPKNVTREELVAAAVKLVDVEDESESPLWCLMNARIAFCDITLDGIPEIFFLSTQIWDNTDGYWYKYENGEYVYRGYVNAFGEGTRLYKDKNGNPFILELETNLDSDDETGDAYFHNTHYIYDVTTKKRTEIAYAKSTAETKLTIREFYVGDNLVSSEEYLSTIYSGLAEYTLVGDILDLMGDNGAYHYSEHSENMNAAYDEYLEKNK